MAISLFIFSCNSHEDMTLNENSEAEAQIEEASEPGLELKDGATLILDEEAAQMTYEERVEYYASKSHEELLELLSTHEFSNSESEKMGCTWSFYDVLCNSYYCSNTNSGYYPHYMEFHSYDCGLGWGFCSYNWSC